MKPSSDVVAIFCVVILLALAGTAWLGIHKGSEKRAAEEFELDKRTLCDGGLAHCTISEGRVGGYTSKWTTCECPSGSP